MEDTGYQRHLDDADGTARAASSSSSLSSWAEATNDDRVVEGDLLGVRSAGGGETWRLGGMPSFRGGVSKSKSRSRSLSAGRRAPTAATAMAGGGGGGPVAPPSVPPTAASAARAPAPREAIGYRPPPPMPGDAAPTGPAAAAAAAAAAATAQAPVEAAAGYRPPPQQWQQHDPRHLRQASNYTLIDESSSLGTSVDNDSVDIVLMRSMSNTVLSVNTNAVLDATPDLMPTMMRRGGGATDVDGGQRGDPRAATEVFADSIAMVDRLVYDVIGGKMVGRAMDGLPPLGCPAAVDDVVRGCAAVDGDAGPGIVDVEWRPGGGGGGSGNDETDGGEIRERRSASAVAARAEGARRRAAATPPRGSRSNASSNGPSKSNDGKLGTYSGVFLPCLAQIVGVIFFLRLPTITGQAGTIGATLVVLACVFSTLVTSLSLSAIASNGTIQAGGPYYIISRTLGVEIGGAMGLLFYLGTTLGASMHVMGAIEVLAHEPAFAQLNLCPSQVWSLAVMAVIAKIVAVGSKHVTNATNFFLVATGLSIFSILLGTVLLAFGWFEGSLDAEDRVFNDNLYPRYQPDPTTGVAHDFWSLVSIFYPACTGILAGTNRSPDLADPKRSIPVGTIGAIAVTTLLYLFQIWLLGSVVSNEVLINNKLVLAAVAFPSRIVAKIGMVTSCIGAALQCMAGAPQLLGAIAADDAIPFLKFLTWKKRRQGGGGVDGGNSKGGDRHLPLTNVGALGLDSTTSRSTRHFFKGGDDGADDASAESETSTAIKCENSNRAVWFTWAIASLGAFFGNIDHITPILTMFYLMMYGGINLCCFLLAWVDSPGFRPQFKYFSAKLALLGFLWCLVLSFLISWLMATVAILLLFAIFKYIRSSEQSARSSNIRSTTGTDWGDLSDSARYKITTAMLAKVSGTENFHAKNWRPQLLTVVNTNQDGVPLSSEVLSLAAQIGKGGRGLNIVVSIKQGSYLNKGTFELSQLCTQNLKKCMEFERLQGFCEVIFTQTNFEEAVWSAVTHSGLGPVSPNIVLMSWMADWSRRVWQSNSIGMTQESTSFENGNFHACNGNEFVNTLKGLGNMQRAVCILKGTSFPQAGDIMPIGSTIDIYWIVDDGGLCLLLSYIISRSSIWRQNAYLQVFAVVCASFDSPEKVKNSLIVFLHQVRINATVQIVRMDSTDLANDFRAVRVGGSCPSCSPRLTIGEKFRAGGNGVNIPSSPTHVDPYLAHSNNGTIPENVDLASSHVEPHLTFPTNSSIPEEFQKYANGANPHPPQRQQFLHQVNAHKLNEIIRWNSPNTNLIVTHLPLSHKASKSNEYMEYVETMFQDIENMLLVQGTGVQYLTDVA